MLIIPKFAEKAELFKFLIENEKTLISQKKAGFKLADGMNLAPTILKSVAKTLKSPGGTSGSEDLKVKAIINTTNVMDSHDDVHINGLWNKSIKDNPGIMHVQEHKSSDFDKIISDGDDLKASVKNYTWKELGYDMEGETQALVFDSTVKETRNAYMHNQYKNGYVKNHSVGMRYVKLALAINDDSEGIYHDNWKQYIDIIANKQDAIDQGYFYAVTEAKVIEGSAVPRGSNPFTPTQAIKDEKTIPEMKAEAIKSWLGIK